MRPPLRFLAHLNWNIRIGLRTATSKSNTMIKQMQLKQGAWLFDKNYATKKAAYKHARHLVRSRLCVLRDIHVHVCVWWSRKAADNLNSNFPTLPTLALISPRVKETTLLHTADGKTLLYVWQWEDVESLPEHFKTILNQPTSFSQDAINDVQVFPICS